MFGSVLVTLHPPLLAGFLLYQLYLKVVAAKPQRCYIATIMLTFFAILIGLSVLILVHELGHFLAAKFFKVRVEEFGFGFPPKLFSRKKGETEYSLNAFPLGGFVRLYGEELAEEGKTLEAPERSFTGKPIWQRAIILSAGVAMNFILGWALISFIFMVGIPQAVVVNLVSHGSPAELVGLKTGDKFSDFKKVEDFTKYINANKGKEVILKIERGGKNIELKVTPRVSPPAGEGALGVGLMESGAPKMGFFESIYNGLISASVMTVAIAQGIVGFVAGIFMGQGVANVMGPVGIINVAAQTANIGLIYFVNLIAILSLNLAVLNVFPFPALDGGRIFFLAIEKIKGAPLSRRFEMWANGIGFALLMLLVLIVTIKDVIKLF